jgi:hypothetical protein
LDISITLTISIVIRVTTRIKTISCSNSPIASTFRLDKSGDVNGCKKGQEFHAWNEVKEVTDDGRMDEKKEGWILRREV